MFNTYVALSLGDPGTFVQDSIPFFASILPILVRFLQREGEDWFVVFVSIITIKSTPSGSVSRHKGVRIDHCFLA